MYFRKILQTLVHVTIIGTSTAGQETQKLVLLLGTTSQKLCILFQGSEVSQEDGKLASKKPADILTAKSPRGQEEAHSFQASPQ